MDRVLPPQSTVRHAPTVDLGVANKKYVDDEIDSATPTLGAGRWERLADQTISNASPTLISWDTAVDVDDPNDDFDLTTTTLTVNTAGWYRFDFGVIWNPDSSGFRIARLTDTSSTIYAESRLSATPTSNMTQGGSCIVKAAASDTFGVEAYQNTGGNLIVAGASRTFLSVERIR